MTSRDVAVTSYDVGVMTFINPAGGLGLEASFEQLRRSRVLPLERVCMIIVPPECMTGS